MAEKLNRAASTMREAWHQLQQVQKQQDIWMGEAAQAFITRLEELPKHLKNADESLSNAAKAIGSWEDSLTGYQDSAQDLERKARAARSELVEAEDAEAAARENPDLDLAGKQFPSQAEADAATQRVEAAQRAADEAVRATRAAHEELRELLRQAEQLQNEHHDQADAVANRIRSASDGLAPPEPGWLEQVGSWLKDNLKEIGDIAGMISAVAGALAFVPGLNVIAAPVALIAGGVALAAHGADMAVNGKWDSGEAWMSLGGDTLGMIPGVRAVKEGVTAFKGAAEGATTAADLVPAAQRGITALSSTSLDATAMSSRFGKDIAKLPGIPSESAPTIAKTFEGGFNTATQVPTAVEMSGGGKSDALSDAAAQSSLASSANSAGDTLAETNSGARVVDATKNAAATAGHKGSDVFRTLGRLGRAVG